MSKEETIVPEFIKTTLDVKAKTIFQFQNACEFMKSKNAEGDITLSSPNIKVSLVTPQGLVTGSIDLSNYSVDASKNNFTEEELESMILNNTNKLFSDIEKSSENLNIINLSTTIVVRDATLIPWNNSEKSFEFSTLYLFSSDISGFTIGSRKQL
jgi:hypothetical protein